MSSQQKTSSKKGKFSLKIEKIKETNFKNKNKEKK